MKKDKKCQNIHTALGISDMEAEKLRGIIRAMVESDENETVSDIIEALSKSEDFDIKAVLAGFYLKAEVDREKSKMSGLMGPFSMMGGPGILGSIIEISISGGKISDGASDPLSMLANMGAEAVESMTPEKAEMLRQELDRRGLNSEKHDCDECKEKGACPIEHSMRKLREVLGK